MSFLKWLFPDGLGTRAILAMIVVSAYVAAAIARGDVAGLKEIALIALGFYFIQRALLQKNGTQPIQPPE